MRGPIKEVIERRGQKYVDEPTYKIMKPKRQLTNTIAQSVAKAFQSSTPEPIIFKTGYTRVMLSWTKPKEAHQ